MTAPMIIGRPTEAELNQSLLSTTWRKARKPFVLALLVTGGLTALMIFGFGYKIAKGVGVWGNNIPVGWGFPIVNFVWWIGIGHAGTFISAILYLVEQPWRNAISRFAEAMTIFAVIQAGLFPVLHLGRPWFVYWMLPYPAVMRVWPNVRSAFPWDGAAIGTYITVSILFWYLGMLPDLASLRDTAPKKSQRIIYGLLAGGFRGDATAYRHYRSAYLILAGLATPLVVSVHSIVACDFAIALTPGWHSTIFPPFFVAGAIYSGFAMVLSLSIGVRWGFKIDHVVTLRHIENCAKLALTTGLMVGYGYITEMFTAWYSADPFELYQYFHHRPGGPMFWVMLCCNIGTAQFLWFKRVRTNLKILFPLSILMNVGMWSERFVIIVNSLEREFLPSKWENYYPTWVDWSILIGTIGFFTFLFLLFLRFLPIISVAEVKELNASLREKEGQGGA